MDNCKRTVSHQYQNWNITSTSDPQVQRLFGMWPSQLDCCGSSWLTMMTPRFSKKQDESAIGNPIRIWRHDRLISSDLAHSVRERNLFLRALKLDGSERLPVAEIGGGQGRFAEILGHTTNYRHFIFDIQIELLPDGLCDLFMNMRSLVEMRMEQIEHYLKHIDRLSTTGFMSRQWLTWTNTASRQYGDADRLSA